MAQPANGGNTPIGGSRIPGLGNISPTLPVVQGASGDQSGITQSAIAPGTIIIRAGADGAVDAASQAVANTISRDTAAANAGALTQEFDAARRAEIDQSFAATRELAAQTQVFFANAAAAEQRLRNRADDPRAVNEDGTPLTTAQRQALVEQANGLRDTFGATSPLRIFATALNGAAGGNAAGGLGYLGRAFAGNVVQAFGVSVARDLANDLLSETRNADGSTTYTANVGSEVARIFLQGAVGCAGQALGGGDCGSGAFGGAGSAGFNVVYNEITGRGHSFTVPASVPAGGAGGVNPLSLEQQQAQTNAGAAIIGAFAGALGLDVNSAVTSAVTETENNAESTPRGPVVRTFTASNYGILELATGDTDLATAVLAARRPGETNDDGVIARYQDYIGCLESATRTCDPNDPEYRQSAALQEAYVVAEGQRVALDRSWALGLAALNGPTYTPDGALVLGPAFTGFVLLRPNQPTGDLIVQVGGRLPDGTPSILVPPQLFVQNPSGFRIPLNGWYNGAYYAGGRPAAAPPASNGASRVWTSADYAGGFGDASNGYSLTTGLALDAPNASGYLSSASRFGRLAGSRAVPIVGGALTYGRLYNEGNTVAGSITGSVAGTATGAGICTGGALIGAAGCAVIPGVNIGTPICAAVGCGVGVVVDYFTETSDGVADGVARRTNVIVRTIPPPRFPAPPAGSGGVERDFRVPTCSIFSRSPICFPDPLGNPDGL